MTLSLRSRFAGIIGNCLGHYDTALFGLLAPFIAPLFFDDKDPLTALILTYGMMPLGILAKPLGSLFFGWIGDHLGRRQALFYSLCGMAIVTILMGCLPLYRQVGILAPCLLAVGRMLQSFCAAGEITGASIFVLENTPLSHRTLISSWYDVSSILGALIASSLVTFFCTYNWIEEWWRYLFWIGGVTAIFGLFLRLKTQEGYEFQSDHKKCSLYQALKDNKKAFISIVLASGFSYTTYTLSFNLMNGYVPIVTSLSQSDVMQVNTALLVFDMCLLPCFGYLAHKIGKEKVMLAGALCSTLTAISFFYFLKGSSLLVATLIRCVIVMCATAFAAPFHAWKLDCMPAEYRYTLLSLGYTLGTQLIGAPASAICLWLYKQLGYVWAPGLYLMLVGSLAAVAVYKNRTQTCNQQT